MFRVTRDPGFDSNTYFVHLNPYAAQGCQKTGNGLPKLGGLGGGGRGEPQHAITLFAPAGDEGIKARCQRPAHRSDGAGGALSRFPACEQSGRFRGVAKHLGERLGRTRH